MITCKLHFSLTFMSSRLLPIANRMLIGISPLIQPRTRINGIVSLADDTVWGLQAQFSLQTSSTERAYRMLSKQYNLCTFDRWVRLDRMRWSIDGFFRLLLGCNHGRVGGVRAVKHFAVRDGRVINHEGGEGTPTWKMAWELRVHQRSASLQEWESVYRPLGSLRQEKGRPQR